MEHRIRVVLVAVAVGWTAALMPAGADACSTFLLRGRDGLAMAKNYDWNVGSGMLVVNPRGLAKTAVAARGGVPAQWDSRHGSVTFNQYGREFPSGGMNEAGLAIELMWLQETRYPEADSRSVIGTLQWIQRSLDLFESVDQVVDSARRLRVVGQAPLHFLVCDRSGACATVEFLNGELVAHHGSTLPVPVLTNSTYDASLHAINRRDSAGDRIGPWGNGSLARFARAAAAVKGRNGIDDGRLVDEAFAILGSVAQGDFTQWSIVYRLDRGVVTFKTAGNPRRRTVRLADLDFTCGHSVQALDLAAPVAGDVAAHLSAWSVSTNLESILEAVSQTDFLKAIPRTVWEQSARYPERADCIAR